MDRAMLNRRMVLAMVPALAMAGRASVAAAGRPGIAEQAGFQKELAPFWGQLAMLPAIREPARGKSAASGFCSRRVCRFPATMVGTSE